MFADLNNSSSFSIAFFIFLILNFGSLWTEYSITIHPELDPYQRLAKQRLKSVNHNGSCGSGSCYPATGDLLIGRENQISATSTCGFNKSSRYCIVSHLEDAKKCFYCDSRLPYDPMLSSNSHLIQNVISSGSHPDYRKKTWWQAENGVEDVSIRLDMEAEFHFTHLIMTFKTFRPAAMILEKSSDFGKTWKAVRYFASDCRSSFPGIPLGPLKSVTDVVCISRYSSVAPSTAGEIIHRARPPYLELENPYGKEVQELLKMTNLRINFTKLHTLGDNLLDNRDEVREKYYYALFEMVVRGSCSCYGHASRCIPLPGQAQVPNMVYGRCECNHHTKGLNCDQCEDFYNDVPWRPAHGDDTNACKKCDCNLHANRCHFDPTVYRQSGLISGGVCDECQHNTQGNKCEQCKPRFFRLPRFHLNHSNVCQACECDLKGSLNDGQCETGPSISDGGGNHTAQLVGKCYCKRFVQGLSCNTCKDGYWNLDLKNPEGCEACTCLIIGTVNNFGCDKNSGRCVCKEHVTGTDCESCKPGYYGLSREDLKGCRACDCDPGGSTRLECDQKDGECACKPGVVGRTCNATIPGQYCAELDSYTYQAEKTRIDNQFASILKRGREGYNLITWTGDGFVRVREGGQLIFIVSDITSAPMYYQLVIRYELPMEKDWEEVIITLEEQPMVSYMYNTLQYTRRLARDDGLEYGDHFPFNQFRNVFNDGSNRDGSSNRQVPNHCADFSQPSVQVTYLQKNVRYTVVPLPYCLQPNFEYIVKLEFTRYATTSGQPEANVLVDAISFVPTLESMPLFKQSLAAPTSEFHRDDRNSNESQSHHDNLTVSPAVAKLRDEFERYRCRDAYITIPDPSLREKHLPEPCKKHRCSLALSMHGRGKECNCDPTGSESSVCETSGGQCKCKPNVIGRRCDRCAPGTFGFGPSGCTACNCDGRGSLDPICDSQNGQCKCIPGVVGLTCDTCPRGYWNFPNCEPCRCNGHSETCNPLSGDCSKTCRDSTDGPHCERCAPYHYGDPRIQVNIPCRACMCPGMVSDNQFADSCFLDPSTREMVCRCKLGYTGKQCEKCADNWFGRPLLPGGSCTPCFCNNNQESTLNTGVCHSETGECLACAYNTQGFNCEHCRDGYFGVALTQSCASCVCNSLGTNTFLHPPRLLSFEAQSADFSPYSFDERPNSTHLPLKDESGLVFTPSPSPFFICDKSTGQCPCLPNVTGLACDTCLPGHWNLANGKGCQACGCCADRSSLSDQCNLLDGQCRCKPGFGGRDCCDCEDNYWGDPKVKCFSCECNVQGSTGYQCDRKTGKCSCLTGMTGPKCDMCDRGTIGQVPYCQSCGQCFKDWDNIVKNLLLEAESLVIASSQIKDSGVASVYSIHFQGMEKKIEEVEHLLKDSNVTASDLNVISNKIEELRQKLLARSDDIDTLIDFNKEISGEIDDSTKKLLDIKKGAQGLRNQTDVLEENATRIQEADVEGAFSIIRDSWEKTRDLKYNVTKSMRLINDSASTRERVKSLMETSRDNLEKGIKESQANISQLDAKIFQLRDSKLGDLNTMICDGHSMPCDATCGGAGCGGKCGGIGCENGALTKSANALELVKESKILLDSKRKQARDLLEKVESAEKESKKSLKTSESAYQKAWQALNSSQTSIESLQSLLNRSQFFLTEKNNTPVHLETIAQQVLAMNVSLNPQEITNLANEINRTLSSLTRIDEILASTQQDVDRANVLNNKATKANEHAVSILKMAEKVKSDLNDSKIFMDKAQALLDKITLGYDNASIYLKKIKENIDPAQNSLEGSVKDIEGLKTRLKNAKSYVTKSNIDLTTAAKQSRQADALNVQAETAFKDLESQYQRISGKVNSEISEDSDLSRRAQELKLQATMIAQNTLAKLKAIDDMQKNIDEHETEYKNLTKLVSNLNKRMQIYLPQINEKAVMYRTCNP